MWSPWRESVLDADGWPGAASPTAGDTLTAGDGPAPGDSATAPDGPARALAAALAPRFSLAPDGRPRRVRRTWLDTFDWRLHRAGFMLELSSGAGPAELTLTAPDGTRVAAAAGRARWPAPASGLPGELRDRLAGPAGVRALLPVAQVAGVVRRFRVRNSDDKTVAWLTLEETTVTGAGPAGAGPAIPPRAAPPPAGARPAAPGPAGQARLTVSAVRGYQAQADRVTSCLLALPGVTTARLPVLTAALAASGRFPGDYTGKVEVTLDPAAPARDSVAAVLLYLLGTLEANVPGTLRHIDTEFLHDLRVSVRRTRSALKLAGDVLPPGLAERYRGEFKWLGDATTPTRDLDVYLLTYPQMTACLVAAEPADLEPYRAYLARRHAAEQRRLARALRSARFAALSVGWRADLSCLAADADGPTTAALAAARIGRAHRRVLRHGGGLTPGSPPEDLHELRKRCKELRYALEFFASLHDPASHRRAVRELKGLQDCLGEFQDCQVQTSHIAASAFRMRGDPDVGAATLLAMGELAGQLALRARRAREEFAGRFAGFASNRTRDVFRALTAGGHR